VQEVTLADLDNGGDQTAQLALKFSTGTSPDIQANAVTCLGAAGPSILVGNTAGVDFIPDETTTTVYSMTSANVTKCDIKGSYIAYIVNGFAYSRDLPSANWTLDVGDQSAIQPNVVINNTNMATNVRSSIYMPRPKGCATGDAGETTHLLCIEQNLLELYKINGDNTFTLVDSLVPGLSFDVRGVHGDYYFGCTDGGWQHLYLYKRVGDTIQFMDDVETTNNVSLESDQIKFNSDATVIKCAISASASDGSDVWRIHQLFTRSGDTLGWTGQNWEYDNMTTKCGFSDPNGYTVSPGCYNNLNQQAEDSYLLFDSNLTDLGMAYPQIALGEPAWVTGTLFVAIEQTSAAPFNQYLCLYEVVSDSIVSRGNVFLSVGNILGGNNPLGVPQTEVHRYELEVVNGVIILFHRHYWFGGWPGNYDGPLTTEFYEVNGTTLSAISGSLTFAANNWVSFVDNVYKIFGTRWICKINDFDNATGVNTTRYNIFDFDNGSSPAYGAASCLQVESGVFIGTDQGIFVEDPSDKTTRHIVSLDADDNVVSIEASSDADKDTGFLTYGVDDDAGTAKHGYLDLGTPVPAVPEDEDLTTIDLAWRVDIDRWGHDNMVHLPDAPGVASAVQLVTWYLREAGVYNAKEIRVKRRGDYMRVGHVPVHMVYLVVSSPVDQVDTYTMTVFDEEITWVYSTGDNYTTVLTFFENALQERGIDTYRNSAYLYAIGELSRFVTFAVTAGNSYFLLNEQLPIQVTLKSEEDSSNWSTEWDFTTA
jgi:hypothetical protein